MTARKTAPRIRRARGKDRAGAARSRRARLCGLIAALALVACARGDGREPLIVYSTHGRDMLQAFEQRFEAANPGVDVQWLDMGSQEVLDRLRSERANPQADVWWGAPADMFETAKEESLLEPFAPSWGEAAREHSDPEGHWWATYLTPEVIAFNSEAVPAAEAPRDWDDILDPRWKGKVLIRDPIASGTMRAIFGMILYRSIRQTGDTVAGFEWLRRLDGQTKEYVLNPTLLYQKLARQEGLVTLWDMPDIETVKSRSGLPLDYTIARSGTPLVVDGVAVVRGARHPELARKFVEYVGGTEGALLAAREFHRLPARADLPADSLPGSLRRAREAIVPEPMDWMLLRQRLPAWIRLWDEQVRGRGR